MPILQVSDLKKIYTTRFGGQQVQALTSVNFAVEPGEYVAIMGESGSGKTTLLNILAALDKPTSGQVLLDGKNIVAIKEKDIAAFRRDHLGFVFQDFNLLDTFSIQDNILLPLVLAGKRFQEMENQIRRVSLTEHPGEVANYLKEMGKRMEKERMAPHKIAEAFKMVSEQFGIQLPDDFVKVPAYEQMNLFDMGMR